MRWIFYTLVAVNLCYFAWEMANKPEAGTVLSHNAAAERESEWRTIELLSEAREKVKLLTVDSLPEYEELQELSGPLSDEPGLNSEAEAGACGVFGPFVDAREADRFVSVVSGLKVVPQQYREQVTLAPFYWAYLPPFESVHQALQMVNKLKEKRVQSFLISEGEFKDGLSLGVHESRSELGLIERTLLEFDLELQVVEKSRSYENSWVQIPLQGQNFAESDFMAGLHQQYPHIRYRQKVCKSVASAD